MAINAKFYPVAATVGGVAKTIGILATEQPDSLGGGGSVQIFPLLTVGQTTLACTGATVKRNPKLQCPALEVLDGIAVSYVYNSSYTQRTASATIYGNPVSEIQVVVPRYIAGDSILAVQIGGVWWDLNVDARAWARSSSQ